MGNCDIPSWLFFFIWIKIWNSHAAPFCPYNWVTWPFISLLHSLLCSGCPSLDCLTGLGWRQGSVKLGPSHERGQWHITLPQRHDSSPGSGERIRFFPSVQYWVTVASWAVHLTGWTWLVTEGAGLCRPTVGFPLGCIFVFCFFLNKSTIYIFLLNKITLSF